MTFGCRNLAIAREAFKAAIAEKPAGAS